MYKALSIESHMLLPDLVIKSGLALFQAGLVSPPHMTWSQCLVNNDAECNVGAGDRAAG